MQDVVSARSVNPSATLYKTVIDVLVSLLKGVACKEDGNGWEFLGLLPMFVSPPLPSYRCHSGLINMQVRPASFRHGRNDC